MKKLLSFFFALAFGASAYAQTVVPSTSPSYVTATGTLTAGQIAYWSTVSGNYQITGATVSGDCSFNSSFIITCTKTNGTLFAPSATTDTTNAGNITSGSLSMARFSGCSSSSTYLNGAGSCTTPSGGSAGVIYSGTTYSTIAAGTNVTITPSGSTLTLSAAGGSGSGCIPSGAANTLLVSSGSSTCNSAGSTVIANGFTLTLPSASSTLTYQIGSVTSGDCVQWSGTAGGQSDTGAACGSGGSTPTAGGGLAPWVATGGVDYFALGDIVSGALGTASFSATTVYYFPIIVPNTVPLTNLGVYVSTAGSGTIQSCIYNSTGTSTQLPNNLIASTSGSNAAVGYVGGSPTLSNGFAGTLQPFTLYWTAIVSTTAVSVRTIGSGAFGQGLGMTSSTSNSFKPTITNASGAPTSCPSNAGSSFATGSNAAAPAVLVAY